ncbi:MAG: peptidoglycan DD-metalloendopeptidase family protein [Rickettsiaceae bacterium]
MRKNQSLFILIAILLCSCATQQDPAPIEYNHRMYPAGYAQKITPTLINKEQNISNNLDEQIREITKQDDSNFVIPTENPNINRPQTKIIYHEVQVGETIEDIAIKYSTGIKDIANLNDLLPPYDLDEFEIIKIRTKEDNTAKSLNSDLTKTPPKKQYINPLHGKIITKFGEKTAIGVNKGINIAAKQGTKIIASASGTVIYADYNATFGNLLIIKLDGTNIVTSYAHMQDLILSKGTHIKQGDVVGYVGQTGKISQPQLHFGIREGKIAKDPSQFIQF